MGDVDRREFLIAALATQIPSTDATEHQDMTRVPKFCRMVELARSDRETRQQLLRDPERTLRQMGLTPASLNEAHDRGALARATQMLTAARIAPNDDAAASLKKLGVSADANFRLGYEIEVEPFGIRLLERVRMPPSSAWTATASTKCTWSPWDGCGPDVDG